MPGLVEMVLISVKYNTFHPWSRSQALASSEARKALGLFFLLYALNGIHRPRISSVRRVKRTLVVLKSPFHYKGPKHHIQYSFYTTCISFGISRGAANSARRVLSTYFLQNKPSSCVMRRNSQLRLSSLLLKC